jgi:hypothetical protein
MHKLLLLFLITGCASKEYKNVKKEIRDGNISTQTILDLARSSYLKGCSDNSKLSFSDCLHKAKTHQKEIREILK